MSESKIVLILERDPAWQARFSDVANLLNLNPVIKAGISTAPEPKTLEESGFKTVIVGDPHGDLAAVATYLRKINGQRGVSVIAASTLKAVRDTVTLLGSCRSWAIVYRDENHPTATQTSLQQAITTKRRKRNR